jgi:hypothetical protein
MPDVTDATSTYGFIADLARTIPEVRDILNKAISGKWTPDRFTSAVQDSRWWKTHGETVRQRAIQQVTDPASFKTDLNEARRRVQQMMSQTGLKLSAKLQDFAAHSVLSSGWNDVDLHNYLGQNGVFTNSGESEQTRAKLAGLAADYGIGTSTAFIANATRRVMTGADTVDAWQSRWRKQAESAFPALKAELESGQTIRQIADPYISQYAQTLEVSPTSIDLTSDQLLRRALAGKDEKGNPVAMPLWQFDQALKQDPRYDKTAGAKTEAFTVLHQVGRDLGMAS